MAKKEDKTLTTEDTAKNRQQATDKAPKADVKTLAYGGAPEQAMSPMQVAQNERDASGDNVFRPNSTSHTVELSEDQLRLVDANADFEADYRVEEKVSDDYEGPENPLEGKRFDSRGNVIGTVDTGKGKKSSTSSTNGKSEDES